MSDEDGRQARPSSNPLDERRRPQFAAPEDLAGESYSIHQLGIEVT
jgi:hypothetical protein